MPTFLFTDIEGSTARWESSPNAMSAALSMHDAILQESVTFHDGRIIKHTGDGIIAHFDNGRATECALHAQASLQAADWSSVGGLAIRMCVYAGEAEERDGDFFGPAMNGAARMMSAAWGGQVLVNDAASRSEALPDGATLVDAGVHVLRDLMEPQQIYILAHASIPSEFPALRTVSSRPQNLPVQPTPFHGRARELDEVCAMISDPGCRLLTILAPGGTGKSRLALQSAARLITGFRHGAFFVRLEDVPAAAMIPAAMAAAMSFRFSGPVPEEAQLAAFLADREVLVIADNFEHLSKDSPILARLLGNCPGLRIVVTSRHRLNLREERVFELQGMALPEPDGSDLEGRDASGLFLATADRAKAGYRPEAADRPAIAAICSLVEGSPLGIELASSWVRVVPAREIESELRRSFELLDSAPLDMPGRHRGLEAVFEYSWSLLDEKEKEALAGLSVFAGEFDTRAASDVAGCSLPVLRRLLDKSLLQSPAQGRFGMHPIVHAYAAAKLGKDATRLSEMAESHACYFAARLNEDKGGMQQADSGEVLKRMESALPDILQAWDHSVRHWQAADTKVFFIVLSHLFIVRSTITIASQIFRDKLELLRERWKGPLEPAQASVLCNLVERMATFRQMAGSPEEARPLLQEALELAAISDDSELEPRILGTLGITEARAGNNEAARADFERMLEKVEAIGDLRKTAVALTNLATLESLEGNREKSLEYYEKALDCSRRLGDIIMQMRTLGSMGFMLIGAHEEERALKTLEESLGIARNVGDKRSEELALLGMADILSQEEPDRAMQLALECLHVGETIEHVSMIAHSWLVIAWIQASRGLLDEAREAVDKSVALFGGDLDRAAKKKLEEIESLIAGGPA